MCKTLPLIIIGIFSLFFLSCHRIPFYGYTEGVVQYTINYPQLESAGNPIVSLLPSSAKTYFDKNHLCTEISGPMGTVKITMIVSTQKKEIYASLKLLTTKIYTIYDSNKIKEKLSEYPSFVVLPFSGEPPKVNCFDITCYKYTIISTIPGASDFDLLASTQIKWDYSWFTPYTNVKGFLLKYRAYYFGLLMDFTATSISSEDVDSKTFEPNTSYTYVSPEDFEKEIKETLKLLGIQNI